MTQRAGRPLVVIAFTALALALAGCGDSKRLLVVPGSDHGTDLLDGQLAHQLRAFLASR